MENVLLIVHLILALFLIVVVLMQRSEGGALGIGGGGGGGGGVMSGRAAGTALTKATWALGAAFIATSLALSILAASNAGNRSVVTGDGVIEAPAPAEGVDEGLQGLIDTPDLPGAGSDADPVAE